MGRQRFAFSLFAGSLILVLGVWGFFLLGGRPGIPAPDPPQRLVRVDGLSASRTTAIEFHLVPKRVGDPVTLEVERDGRVERVESRIVPYYAAAPVPVVFLVSGLFAAAMGFFVLALRRRDLRARIFFALSLAFASAVLINGDTYGVRGGRPATLLPGLLFNFAYALAPLLLLRFVLTFLPAKRPLPARALYAPGLLAGAALNVTLVAGYLSDAGPLVRLREGGFFLFRWYLVAAMAAGLAALVAAAVRARSGEERAQLKWVLVGLSAGVLPFLLFYEIPKAAGLVPPLPEEWASLFFFLIPPAFAIAIVRHRLMDVDVVINRGLVYTPLTVLTAAVYLLAVEALRGAFARVPGLGGGRWIPAAAAVLAAVAFQAGRRRIQTVVDKAFFRRAYDYRKAVSRFSEQAPAQPSYADLFALFCAEAGRTLEPERLGIVLEAPSPVLAGGTAPPAAPPPAERRVLLRSALSDSAARALCGPAFSAGGRFYARRSAVEECPLADFSRDTDLPATGYELALPLSSPGSGLAGAIAAGRKKSGARYTSDDLELLATLGAHLASQAERLRLHEDVARERASREQLAELNRLKTRFISEVSHELRTPMTSIQGLSEILLDGDGGDERRNGLLRLMGEECARLSRFLHNVLDFGAMERGAKSYRLRPEALNPIVLSVADLFRAARGGEGYVIEADVPEAPLTARVDPDAVRQALVNLVDNAIKYSGRSRTVRLALAAGPGCVAVTVADSGIGMSKDEAARIFESFYRAPDAARLDPRGTGIGLTIVRHIVDGHGGRVRVESEPGKGSAFTLEFPT